jgi:hypothetical protein
LIVLSLAVLSVSSCLASPPSTAASPFAQAHSIARSWWPKAEGAFISGNPKTLTDLYGASALDVATGEMQMATLTGGRPRYPRPFRDSAIFLPAAGADSNWFLGIIRYAPVDQDGRAAPVEMSAPGMIFSESDGIWKVVAADVQAPITHDAFATNESRFSAPADDARYIMPRSAVASAYASYLNNLSAGQQSEVPFPTGLTSFAWQFTRIAWPPGSIAIARYSFAVDTSELAEYSITSGLTKAPDVVLFVLRRTVVLKPRQGCLVRRPGDLWSAVVPPGAYSSVTLSSVSVVAATVPINDGDTSQGRKIIDISAAIDDVSAAGVGC